MLASRSGSARARPNTLTTIAHAITDTDPRSLGRLGFHVCGWVELLQGLHTARSSSRPSWLPPLERDRKQGLLSEGSKRIVASDQRDALRRLRQTHLPMAMAPAPASSA